ncbi:hypothetical protein IFM89_013643 [Coptis chinensis]|uniref:Subtilisin-like protease fibronectin type-III domain-containing protein n=1 Tax=Coptis chinensis TaxID=261450 RepID=A0A835M8S3_9MAGN|nr:hypothetical protein IFM89_013643 [Coptis chinensis]
MTTVLEIKKLFPHSTVQKCRTLFTLSTIHPSLAISTLKGTMKVDRTVTNVGGRKSVYRASVTQSHGFSVKLRPKKLFFNDVGEKQSFTITIAVKAKGSHKASNSTNGEYSFGSYTWKDGIHVVRSPIAVSRA